MKSIQNTIMKLLVTSGCIFGSVTPVMAKDVNLLKTPIVQEGTYIHAEDDEKIFDTNKEALEYCQEMAPKLAKKYKTVVYYQVTYETGRKFKANFYMLDQGKKSDSVSARKTVLFDGYVATSGPVNVRKGPGTNYGKCSFSPLKSGTVVGVCDLVKASDGTEWNYIKYNGEYGFVYADYIVRGTGKPAPTPAPVPVPAPTPAPTPTPVTPTNVLSGETCTFKTNKEAMEYGNANVSSIMKKYNKKSVYYTVTYGGPNKFIVQFFG